jgi:3-methylcrotonyl-CoA carboxylase alpha subunit
LKDVQREAVCAAARKAAAAVNYVGAGTIEFVSDGRDVFFIEMNTRLQVEHPVTELITGIDLVEWQLRVAFGEKLPLNQDQISFNGHAIEARVYAENPHKNFMPSVGRIRTWRTPNQSNGLRIDAGYREGDAVSPHYDAMLAKVIAWAPTRDAAIERLNRGLEQTDIRGIVTNIPFLSALLTHPDVRANAIDTGFIERELNKLTPPRAAPGDLELCAAVAAILGEEQNAVRTEAHSPWRTAGWIPVGRRQRVFAFRDRQGAEQKITLKYGNGPAALSIDAREFAFTYSPVDGGFELMLDGIKSHVLAVIEGHELYLRTRNGRFDLHWVDPFGGETEEQVGEDKIVAPLPGTVVALLAQEGAKLEKGAAILTLEVMKMEQTLRAPFAGVLKLIKCRVGDIVQEGVELAEVEPLGS